MTDRQLRVIEAVSEFEELWRLGRGPTARDFASRFPDLAPDLLRELVPVEFDCRLDAGEVLVAEVMLTRYPELRGDNDVLLDLLLSELDHARDSTPDVADYRSRFPGAPDLSVLFDVVKMFPPGELGEWLRNGRASVSVGRGAGGSTGEWASVGDDDPDHGPVRLTETYAVGGRQRRGGVKTVSPGVQDSTRRTVAVKRLRRRAATGPDHLRIEARTQGRLDHQSIPYVLGVGGDGPRANVIVEKFIEGKEWAEAIGTRPMDDDLRTLLTVARAAAYAHRTHQIIHRDIKPQNVMLTEFGETYLVDWGFGLHVGDDSVEDEYLPTRKAANGVVGTPWYMPPESAAGRPHTCTPATDVFMLGGLLYHILTGTPPYDCGPRAALARAVTANVPEPRSRAPGRHIPPALAKIAMKALSLDMRERHRDAGEFADAVETWLRGSAVEAECRAAGNRLSTLAIDAKRRAEAGEPLSPVVPQLLGLAEQFARLRRDWPDDAEEGMRQARNGEEEARFALFDAACHTGDFALAAAQIEELRVLPPSDSNRFQAAASQLRQAEGRRRRLRQALTGVSAVAAGLLVAAVVFAVQREKADAAAARNDELRAVAERDNERLTSAAKQLEITRQRDDALKQAEIDRERRTAIEKTNEALRHTTAVLTERAARADAEQFQSARALFLTHALRFGDIPAIRAQWSEAFTGSLVPMRTSGRQSMIGGVLYTPDGELLLASDMQSGTILGFRSSDGVELFALEGHTRPENVGNPPRVSWGTVRAMAIAPSRPKELITAGLDGTIRIWDLNARREVRRFRLGGEDAAFRLLSLGIEPGGRIVVGDNRGSVRWIAPETGDVIREAKTPNKRLGALAVRGDGLTAGAGDQGIVAMWAADGKSAGELTIPAGEKGAAPVEIHELAFNSDGTRLAAARDDGTVAVWELASPAAPRVLPGHEANVAKLKIARSVAFHGANRLYSGGTDGCVREWDVAKGREVGVRGRHPLNIYGGSSVRGLAVRPDGKAVASSGLELGVKVWDAVSGELLARTGGAMQLPPGVVALTAPAAFSPEAHLLVTASFSPDTPIRIWDTRTLRDRPVVLTDLPEIAEDEMIDRVAAVAVAPDGKRFVTSEPTGDLLVWDAVTGKLLRRIPKAHSRPGAATLAWSPTSDRFASSGEDGVIRVWEADGGKKLAEWAEEPVEPAEPNDERLVPNALLAVPSMLAFTPDGTRLVAAGRDILIRVWDVENRKVATRLRGHDAGISAMTLSGDGRLLAVAGENAVTIWDLKGGFPRATFDVRTVMEPDRFGPPLDQSSPGKVRPSPSFRIFPPITGLAFSPAGRLLAAGLSDGSLALIDLAAGAVTLRGAGHELRRGVCLTKVFFTADGKPLTVGGDRTVRVWDIARLPGAITPFADEVFSRAFAAPDSSAWAVVDGNFGLVRIERATGKRTRWKPEKDGVVNAAYLPDGRLVSVSHFGRVRFHDANLAVVGELGGPEPLTARMGFLDAALTVSPKGDRIAVSRRDGSVDVFDADGKAVTAFKPTDEKNRVFALAFAPRGGELAVSVDDGTITLWNSTSGERLRADWAPRGMFHPNVLFYLPDGLRLVAAGTGGELVVWVPGDPGPGTWLTGHHRTPIVRGVLGCETRGWAMSPDRKYFATCADDGMVRLWRTDRPEPLAAVQVTDMTAYLPRAGPGVKGGLDSTLMGGAMFAVAFSADGSELLVTGLAGKAWVVNLTRVQALMTGPLENLRELTVAATGLRVNDENASPDQVRVAPIPRNLSK